MDNLNAGAGESSPDQSAILAPRPPLHLASLDWVRGLAALGVVLFHFTHNGWLPKSNPVAEFFYYGHVGVKTFFVLSGFVVPYAMWAGGYQWSDWGRFLLRRIVRIYPPYLLAVAGMAVWELVSWMMGHQVRTGVMDVLCHLFYLNDLVGRPWLCEIFWTLGVEIQFYLLAAVLLPLLMNFGRGIAIVSIVALLAVGHFMPAGQHVFAYAPYFALGICLFRYQVKLDPPILSIGLTVICGVLIRYHAGDWKSIIATVPVVLAAIYPGLHGKVGKFLGKVSYSLYLFHIPVWMLVMSVLTPPKALDERFIVVALCVVAAIAAAWGAYCWVEKPCMEWSRRLRYHPLKSGNNK